MKFKFKSVRENGETYEGIADYPDKFQLYKEFREKGETIVFAKEAKKFSLAYINSLGLSMGWVKMRDKIAFARNLGSMIEAGLTLNRSLTVIERQTSSKTFKLIIRSLIDDVNKGKELSFALQNFIKVFPPIFVSMVRAGEAGGTVANSLRVLADQLESTYLLKKKVRGAMIYPSIIVCLIIAIAVLMMIYVVPTLSSVFGDIGTELPFSTRMIIGTSEFITSNWLPSIIALIVLIGSVVYVRRLRFGKRVVDYSVLRIPIISTMAKEVNSARTARTLSSLLTSGVDVVLAMDITKDVVQNSFYKEVLEVAKTEIQKGNPMSHIFSSNENLYPSFVGEMISVGEETGKLSQMLTNLAVFYETEVEQKTKNLSTIIEPLLMVFIGGAVGFFAYAMLTPIYSVMGKM